MSFTAAQLSYLRRPDAVLRRFLWSETRTFSGTSDPIGFWDDLGNVEISGRAYYGSGTLFAVSGRKTILNGSVPSLTVTLSQVSAAVALMARGQQMQNAPLTYSIGIFDPETRELVDGLVPRFRGRITGAEIVEPSAGGAGAITITAKTIGYDLTATRPALRSDAATRLRDPSDTYNRYAQAVDGIEIAFGTAKTKL